MTSMLDKAKAGMIAAGSATARASKRTKLKTDVMMLQGKITTAKKEFGAMVYDQMVAANRPEVERLFNETRTKITALEAQVEAKRQQIQALREPSDASNATDISEGGPPPPAAPPPGAPPPAGPPPGWRATKTAEGKEYYYNETTGETSWTMPAA
jgi:polyhydroxyalkanoate synthesis regulator phasin